MLNFAQYLVGDVPTDKGEKKAPERKENQSAWVCNCAYFSLFIRIKCPHCDILPLLINSGLGFQLSVKIKISLRFGLWSDWSRGKSFLSVNVYLYVPVCVQVSVLSGVPAAGRAGSNCLS